MASKLREHAPDHQSIEQLNAAADQLSEVKGKLEQQQQAETERLKREQEGE